MGVESPVDYIDDLNSALPAAGDARSEGDDHIRNIKKAVKQTFPGITGPTLVTQDQLDLLKLRAVDDTLMALDALGALVGPTAAAVRAALIIPSLADPNILTGTQTIQNEVALEGGDAMAQASPVLKAYRNDATPLTNDVVFELPMDAKNSAGARKTFAKLLAQIGDATDTSEDGIFALATVVAGVLANRLTLGAGLQIGAPTGGDPGVGQLNATGLQLNGVALREFAAGETKDLTSGGPYTEYTFLNIPSWAKRVTVLLFNVSTNGTARVTLRAGHSGGIVSSGYVGEIVGDNGGLFQGLYWSSGAAVDVSGSAARARYARLVFEHVTGNLWNIAISVSGGSSGAYCQTGNGAITLPGTLDRLQVTTEGADQFDSGTARIFWE